MNFETHIMSRKPAEPAKKRTETNIFIPKKPYLELRTVRMTILNINVFKHLLQTSSGMIGNGLVLLLLKFCRCL